MKISVAVSRPYRAISVSSAFFRRIAEYVCRRERCRTAELTFVIVDDRDIQTINKKFLRHNAVTDIITFPLEHNSVNAEIYINAQQMKRQAKEYGVTMKNEMTRLVVHGILHAIGYEDSTIAGKRKMTARQEQYVAMLSLS